MTLKDYIQGKRHGKDANQLERDAVNDPFLHDAIDGFDSVQGNHLEIIEDLEKKIDRNSKRRKIIFRYITVGIAASITLFIGFSILFRQEIPNEKNIAIITKAIEDTIVPDTVSGTMLSQNTDKKTERKPDITQINKNEILKQEVQQMGVVENNINEEDQVLSYNAETTEIKTEKKLASETVYADRSITESAISNDGVVDNLKIRGTASLSEKRSIITGRVLDETGNPVIGASVYTDKNKNGTITDLNGRFTLQKTDGKQLIATYIGYLPKVVEIANDSNIIKLEPNTLALNEVVVVGYGTKRKSSVTGSVAKIENKMEGRVAGVKVEQNNNEEIFGKEEFKEFVFKNVNKNICEGKNYSLTATFKTDKNGKPYDLKILTSNCKEFEEEFKMLFQISPEWTKKNSVIMMKISKP